MTTTKGEATAILKIPGMEKSGRAQQLRRAADGLGGVLQVDINYIQDTATIRYDADRLTFAQVKTLRDEVHSKSPGAGTEPRATNSRNPAKASRYVQGRREEGDVNRIQRRRGRYGRTQRGELGE